MKVACVLIAGVSLWGAMVSGAEAAEPGSSAADAWRDAFARDEFQAGGATLKYRLHTPAPAADGRGLAGRSCH